MLLARLTCWLLAMIHATFNVCLRLVLQPACLCDTIYDWIYERNEFVLRKIISVRHFSHIETTLSLAHTYLTSNGMSDRTFNEIYRIRFKYSNSTDAVQIAMKDILEKKRHTDNKL